MKKTLILAAIMIILPFATFAHGGEFADADEQTSTKTEMMKEDLNHEEMEGLMKSFLVNGKLSDADADLMLVHVNELLSAGMKSDSMGDGGMMGGSDGAGHHGGGDSSEGMMGGGMMWMGLLHGLVAVTSIVWLIAGVLYLTAFRRRNTGDIA